MKLIAFDFDGVICDSWKAYSDAYARIFLLYSKAYPVETREDWLDWYDANWENNFLKHGFNREEVLEIQPVFWNYVDYSKTRVFEGIEKLLWQLSERDDVVLGVVSSTIESKIRPVLYSERIDDLFKFVIGGEVVQHSGKREKAAEALKRARAAPGESVIIGDTTVDIDAGRSCGMKTIGVSYGWTKLEEMKKENPDFLVESPGGLAEALARL